MASLTHKFQLVTLEYNEMCVQETIMEESFFYMLAVAIA